VDASGQQSLARALTESDGELRGRKLGDFVLRESIGEGGFAAVYRCDQPLLGREAVIKVLHQRLRESEVVLQRFMREARLASRLSHPYAAHVYAFGVEPEDGLAWIAMEMVHGTSLEHWLRKHGPLSLEMLVPFFEHVAEVVQDAHDHGIVHRDLKPSNVMMIEYAGRVFPKLLDFGIAKLVDDSAALDATVAIDADEPMFSALGESGRQNLTQANATLGSPPYMSPEQWCDPLSAGPRSDLYSLAVMAYEALTGEQPFTGATIAAIGEQHCSAAVPALPDRFPAALNRVFQRGLAKSAADRPATALAFASELRAAAFPSEAERSGIRTAELLRPPAKRKIWPFAAAGAAALVVAGVATFTLMSGPRDDRAPVLPPAAIAHIAEPPPPAAGVVAAAPVTPAAAPARETVAVEIESTPRGADVFRLPSETKVGATPWHEELPSEAGVQLYLLRKSGYADQRVEIDLRTGGKHDIKLVKSARRSTPKSSAPPSPSPSPSPSSPVSSPPVPVPVRHKGDPVDPFARTP
jgi:eukaryotic-like serine/threonine-protein kinase